MDAAAEVGINPEVSTRFSLSIYMEMSRLTQDGTAESVSRTQILKHVRGFIFPVQLTTNRIGNLTWLIHTLGICYDHTYSTSTVVAAGLRGLK